MHKPSELFVLVMKSRGHEAAADDIADGTVKHRGGVDGVCSLIADGTEQVMHLVSHPCLQRPGPQAPVLHAKLVLEYKSPIIPPQLSICINYSYNVDNIKTLPL